MLAKHDENYMPPEAEDAIDQAHRKLGDDAAEHAGDEAMIPELGQFALILALLVALVQGVVPLRRRRAPRRAR